jgi:hypothetical protein
MEKKNIDHSEEMNNCFYNCNSLKHSEKILKRVYFPDNMSSGLFNGPFLHLSLSSEQNKRITSGEKNISHIKSAKQEQTSYSLE